MPSQLGLNQRLRIVKAERPDVILIQQSRHPLNRPSYYGGTPCVFDADDADILDPRCTDAVIECCRASASVIAGSRYLAGLFRPYNPNVEVVWTGTYLRPWSRSTPSAQRDPVVAWAHSEPLGYPAEADLVRKVVLRLAERNRFTFYVYGVRDEHQARSDDYLAPIQAAGVPVRVFRPMPYARFARTLNAVAVGLHPVCVSSPFSRGKSFGKLLAYLAADVAIVASNAVDHPLFFRHGDNGMLAGDDVDSWVDCCERLLNDPAGRERIVEAGRVDFLRRLTTTRAAELVGLQLESSIGLRARPS